MELFDVFKGQTTERVHFNLEDNNVLYIHVPRCSADTLQALGLSLNKTVKWFLNDKFSILCASEVKKQLDSGKIAEEVIVDMKLS